jgi:hypothetical protein
MQLPKAATYWTIKKKIDQELLGRSGRRESALPERGPGARSSVGESPLQTLGGPNLENTE